MHPIVKGVSLLVIGSATSTAFASNWVHLPTHEWTQLPHPIIEEFVDLSKIQITGNVRRISLKLVQPPHVVRGTFTEKHKNSWEIQRLYVYDIDCQKSSARIISLLTEFENGETEAMPDFPGAHDWKPVGITKGFDPESFTFICALQL